MNTNLSSTLQAFCEQAELLRLAYLDRQGYPRVVPVWFVQLDGAYYIGTGASSAKWKAMQRDARVGWVIDGGQRSQYKGAAMRGHVEEVQEATVRSRVYGRWEGSISMRLTIRSSSLSSATLMTPQRSTCGSCLKMG
jgi:nitroimidazol reductase NimA-like FMN-containing flavoprotein (pyridoxamine 5'-phosphate oxidase superfamily)